MKSHSEKLQALIRKAIDGEWDMFGFRIDEYIPPWYIVRGGQMPTPKVVEKWVPENSLLICDYNDHYFVWEHVIFDHDFAKALIGEEEKKPAIGAMAGGMFTGGGDRGWAEVIVKNGWQHYLKEAVVSDDPIGYLYKAVFNETNQED